jgi:hypothetical protein
MKPIVRVPRQIAERKPPHGAPCNRCGLCCIATLCSLGKHVFQQEDGPCPALLHDEQMRSSCGLVEAPQVFSMTTVIEHGEKNASEAAGFLIGAGYGCDSRINGEPTNRDFNKRLEQWDIDNKGAVEAARKLWGMI